MQTRRHRNSTLSYPRLKALCAASQLGTKPGRPSGRAHARKSRPCRLPRSKPSRPCGRPLGIVVNRRASSFSLAKDGNLASKAAFRRASRHCARTSGTPITPGEMASGGLPVRRYVRGRGAALRSIEAINKHLAQTSGQMRRRQGLRSADPRRRRLVRFAAFRRARQSCSCRFRPTRLR